ncbi:MAG: hypothetical protein AAB459_02665 [Patescibacteria group bacterium]
MANKHQKRSLQTKHTELDSVFFLKLLMYSLVGGQWLWLVNADGSKQLPLPFGLVIGLLFASHEHFKLDRKIEFAVIIIAMLIGFWANMGLYIEILK